MSEGVGCENAIAEAVREIQCYAIAQRGAKVVQVIGNIDLLPQQIHQLRW